MARGVKQKTGLNTDSSIVDAMKRAKERKRQLEEAGGLTSNPTDDLSDELDRNPNPDYQRLDDEIFED